VLNGLRWLESLLDTLRNRVLGMLPGEVRRLTCDAPAAAPDVSVHEPSAPPVSPSLVPLPATESEEVRPRKAPRAKKAATPKKKAGPATARKTASARHEDAAVEKASGSARAPASEPGGAVSALVDALRAHPRQEELVVAGRQKDQLLRSLIPLYLARALDVEVTSGITSRFWGEFGVTYAAPNAAKALRLHTGFAQDTKKGKAITSKGIKYVESALAQLRSADA
jgi:hypothetical protein